MASIQVGFKSVNIAGFATPASHAFAVFANDEGDVSFARAGPAANILGSALVGTEGDGSSPGFGNIVGNFGSFVTNNADFPQNNSDPRAYITVATGTDQQVEGRCVFCTCGPTPATSFVLEVMNTGY